MASLRFFHGPMDCGKSTLALQMEHNLTRAGHRGMVLVSGDRSGHAVVSSRIGLSAPAVLFSPKTDLSLLHASLDGVTFLVVDEAQFLTPLQVEQLASLVDERDVEVYAFGITTDFRSRLFPGSQRLLELCDVSSPLQVEVMCWCGLRASQNARVHAGELVRSGQVVEVGDTDPSASSHYRVLCRRHYLSGELGP